MLLDRRPIKERAAGKWRSVLLGLGVPAEHLTGAHGPCPICALRGDGGKDRWRWDNKAGSGSYICNRCGSDDGVGLVVKLLGVDFSEARRRIEGVLGEAKPEPVKADRGGTPDYAIAAWKAGRPLDGIDPGSRYLISRGIKMQAWPRALRWLPRVTYVHKGPPERRETVSAIGALYVSPDMSEQTVEFIYLDSAGRRRADLDKSRLARGRVPAGGAVRLAPSAETMGIAEGVVTAMSASIMDGVPVWAATNKGQLMKWQPPECCRSVIVYGDSDESFSGQYAAYALAYRLKSAGLHVNVRLPEHGDWNDALLGAA